MKKSVMLTVTASLLLSIFLSGCDLINNLRRHGQKMEISINFKNATALAGGSDSGSRSAREISDNSALMKITKDGSVLSAIKVPSNMEVSKVIGFFQPPAGDNLYVLFNGISVFDYTNENDELIRDGLGQLLCIHPDGSYDDVFGYLADKNLFIMEDYSKIIKFDSAGNLYYICHQTTNNQEDGSYDSMYNLYKYNPNTKQTTKLTDGAIESRFEDFSINKDGTYVFIEGKSMIITNGGYDFKYTNTFLRVIPVANPEKVENIVFYEDDWLPTFLWVYDEYSDALYLSQDNSAPDPKDVGLYKFTAETGYTTPICVIPNTADEPYSAFLNLTPDADGVWGGFEWDEGVYQILDKDRNYINKRYSLPAYYALKECKSYNSDLFILANYIKDFALDAPQKIFKFPKNGGQVTDLFENVPENETIRVTSWSLTDDGSSIYFTGTNDSGTLNGIISTQDNTFTPITSDKTLSCITALKQEFTELIEAESEAQE